MGRVFSLRMFLKLNNKHIAALRTHNSLTHESMSETTINLRFIAALRA